MNNKDYTLGMTLFARISKQEFEELKSEGHIVYDYQKSEGDPDLRKAYEHWLRSDTNVSPK